ncbi:N,N-dimethylformamidase beta subunit family domain-containing protein, partial [Actinomadura adrarensis]
MYIARPRRTDTSGASHIPFIVRDPDRKAPVLIVTSDSTWQAYNHAGENPAAPLTGRSLYGNGTTSAFTFNLATRARAVSYNRPFVTRKHIPQTWLFNAEYPLMRWLERNGYDVDYASCADIDATPELLTGRDVVIVHGHSEYWSAAMRDALEDARDASVHILALSGNSVFWRITYAADRRSFSCWKDTHDGALGPTGVYGGTWRDTRAFNPDRRPENELFGQFFRVNGIREDDLVVPDTYAAHPIWRDTTVATLTSGQTRTYENVLGFEWDEDRVQERPASWIQMSSTTVPVTGMLADEDGGTYTGSGTVTHHLGAYRAASGAVVFGAGMNQLAWAL